MGYTTRSAKHIAAVLKPDHMKKHEEELVHICDKIRSESQKAGLAFTYNLRMNYFGSMSVVVQASLARIDYLLDQLTSRQAKSDNVIADKIKTE